MCVLYILLTVRSIKWILQHLRRKYLRINGHSKVSKPRTGACGRMRGQDWLPHKVLKHAKGAVESLEKIVLCKPDKSLTTLSTTSLFPHPSIILSYPFIDRLLCVHFVTTCLCHQNATWDDSCLTYHVYVRRDLHSIYTRCELISMKEGRNERMTNSIVLVWRQSSHQRSCIEDLGLQMVDSITEKLLIIEALIWPTD